MITLMKDLYDERSESCLARFDNTLLENDVEESDCFEKIRGHVGSAAAERYEQIFHSVTQRLGMPAIRGRCSATVWKIGMIPDCFSSRLTCSIMISVRVFFRGCQS